MARKNGGVIPSRKGRRQSGRVHPWEGSKDRLRGFQAGEIREEIGGVQLALREGGFSLTRHATPLHEP